MTGISERLVSLLLRAQGRKKTELSDSWLAFLVTQKTASPNEDLALLDQHVLSQTLREVLAAGNVECVLDVGAFTGGFFKLVRKIGFRGKVICFEPVAANHAELERSLSNDSSSEIQRCAVGSYQGTTTMRVSRHANFSSALVMSKNATTLFPTITDVIDTLAVPGITLNSFLAERQSQIEPSRTFLKVDVQGSELDVLKGADKYLGSLAGLLVEIAVEPLYQGAPNYLEMLRFTHEAGFDPVGFFPVTRTAGGRTVEFDCLMVNRTLPMNTATE